MNLRPLFPLLAAAAAISAVVWLTVPDKSVVAIQSAPVEPLVNPASSSPASARTPSVIAAQQPSVAQSKKGHSHLDDDSGALPEHLQTYINERRLPASELTPVPNGQGGFSLPARRQWEVVTMAVINPDGSMSTVERQIQPHGQVEVPAQ